MKKYEGKSIVVTGAAAGIGLEATRGFLSEGGRVLAIDRDRETLEASLSGLSGNLSTAPLDVTDETAVEKAISSFGSVDLLFNCAGVVANGALLETTRDDWDRSFLVNVTGGFIMSRAVLPAMLQQKRGVILNMASIVSSQKGLPNRFAYGASKAAVIGMTKSIAADYVAHGIRCNAICPGTVDTPSLKQRLTDTGDYEKALSDFVARQPMGRLARADEIAQLVLYLGSDAAAFMTGQAVAIDGGISI